MAELQYTSVRILTSQYKELQKIHQVTGESINKMVQRGTEIYLSEEGPTNMEIAESIRQSRKNKR